MKPAAKILISTSKPTNVFEKLRFKQHNFEKKSKISVQRLTPLWRLFKPSNNESPPLTTTAKQPNDRLQELLSIFETVSPAQTFDMTRPSSFEPVQLLMNPRLLPESSFGKFFLSSPKNKRFLEIKMPLTYLVAFGTKTRTASILRIDPGRNIGTTSVANATSTVISSGIVPSTNVLNAERIADTSQALVKVKRNLIQSSPLPSKNTTPRNERTNENDKPPLLQSDIPIMSNLSNRFLNTMTNPSPLAKPKKNTRKSFLIANSIMKSPPWTSKRFPTPQRRFSTYFVESALDVPVSLATFQLIAAPLRLSQKILRLHITNQTTPSINTTKTTITAMILIGIKIMIKVRFLQIMLYPFVLVMIPYDFFRIVFGHELVVRISRQRIMLHSFFTFPIILYACFDVYVFCFVWVLSMIFDQLCHYHVFDDDDF